MGIILDLIVVAIVVFFIITSAKRGFVRTLLDVVAFFLSLYLSITFSGVLAEGAYNLFIKDAIVQTVEESTSGLTTSLVNIEEALDSMPDFIANAAENYGVSNKGFAEFLSTADNGVGFAEHAVDYVAKPIIVNALKTVLYIILFIVLCVILKFVARIVNKLFNIPIIGGLNKTLGAIFGLVKGTVIAAALCIAISIIVSLTKDGFLIFTNENIESTYLFKLLASINPLK